MKSISDWLYVTCISALCAVMFTACDKKADDFNLSGECDITTLVMDTLTAVLDARSREAVLRVPLTYDVSSMTVQLLEVSDGARINLQIGDVLNLRTPRTVIVTNGDAVSSWQIRAEYEKIIVAHPKVLFVGLASSYERLNSEEQTACHWMLEHVEQSAYASMAEIANGDIDLSECRVIWWHFHQDGGVDGKIAFENAAADALAAANRLKAFYKAGGSFLLTRYATYLPAYLGEAAALPNNCWGQSEANAETASEPWSFFATGHMTHPLFADLLMKENAPETIFTCDAGYRITNSTAQWHIGTDWGGYADYNAWREATGANDLAYGRDKAIVVWEYPTDGIHGAILCIGSGCYDWYSVQTVSEYWHENIATMTSNAIKYLQ